MKRRSFLGAASAAVVVKGQSPVESPFGVWCQGGPRALSIRQRAPWVKGVFAHLAWSELEPANGKFDWKMFDDAMSAYAGAGLFVLLMVWVGPHSPEWLYSAGVPLVTTSPTLNPRGQAHFTKFPFYLDANYKRFYHRMIRAVAERIDTLPAKVRQRILCVQTAEGSTGDEGGYKGRPLDSKYELPEEKWRAFKFETWKLFDELYSRKRPPVAVLANSGNQGQYDEWMRDNMPHWWRKAGNVGHGYQLNNERDMMKFFDPLINHPETGKLIRVRSEMDEMFKGWFQDNPVWNAYWLNLWALHFGLDIFVHGEEAVIKPEFREGYEFFSRYAGYKDAADSPGAWCALHDGLDAADFQRFPEAAFGKGRVNGGDEAIARSVKIAKSMERFGAVQGDPAKGIAMVMQNRSAARMNDVGWNIESGNYQRYLEQLDAAGTSQAWWRVGPPDQPYGRFARGFDSAQGKTRMFFRFAERFFARGRGALELRVVYLDKGRGEWRLDYDAGGAGAKTAFKVRNADSGRWKEARAMVADGAFRRGCANGADLVLTNSAREDTLFHMVEAKRAAT